MSEPVQGGVPGGEAAAATRDPMDRMAELLRELLASGGVNAAFGEPRTIGDRTVIPAAEVMHGFGFGMGSGPGRGPGAESADGGFGGGGGGGTRTRPVAAIVVGPQGVSVEPILDMTQIWMAALTAGAFSLLWMKRLGRKMGGMSTAAAEPSPRKLAKLFRGR